MKRGIILIFGFTGNLCKRKLIPALYYLFAEKKLSDMYILGIAQGTTTVETIVAQAEPYIECKNQDIWKQFISHIFYQQTDVQDTAAMKNLADYICAMEKKFHLSGDRLVYLAVPSSLFCRITEQLTDVGICVKNTKKNFSPHCIVYEKPFGHNYASAHDINACLARHLSEHQIYRIDHYLTKELVTNIVLTRFTNCVFEPLWHNRYIDQVHIVLNETIGIEDRGAYYDNYGAVRDVMQNHMLQLLALVSMEPPEKLTGDYIRHERARVLEKLYFVSGIRGQYEGYRAEKNVRPNSQTETFAAVTLMIQNHRWAGVPFFLKTGKCMSKNEVAIHIKFKQVDCLLLKNCPIPSDWLTITVSPEARFSLQLNMKKPGIADELVTVAMDFCHSCMFTVRPTQAYEQIIYEALMGEQTGAVRFDEIEYAWKCIDQIYAAQLPLYIYKKGTDGPPELTSYLYNQGIQKR
ncbi:MAG TPA: glucose-6-phosphate dehydrogenase [Candidatus Bathyarchaeia archaeon]|nr:glucose-6-phosphate dehydrogenase [Candidatus Bathyarchaeia archaeon]